MMKIYQIVNIAIWDTFKISQKSLKVNHWPYFILIQNLKNFDDFCILLKEINMNFETESRIKKNSVSPINIQLEDFSIEFTLTEIAAGGALLYIKKIPIIQEMILIFTRLASWNIFLLKLYVLSHLISYLDVFTNTHLYR